MTKELYFRTPLLRQYASVNKLLHPCSSRLTGDIEDFEISSILEARREALKASLGLSSRQIPCRRACL